MLKTSTDDIYQAIRKRYGGKAQSNPSCCDGEPSCSGEKIYASDLSELPAEVTDGSLGCGDPIALAGLEPGQAVLDLGSGGGLDCFLAARQVGDKGTVIGVDMTPEMIRKSERNRDRLGLQNVEFREGQIEQLPVDDNSIDVVISNCVINLSPDKRAVLNDAFRVLKPGGRLAVSDLVRHGQIGRIRRSFLEAWSGCMAGTEEVSDLVSMLERAGFTRISIRTRAGDPLQAGAPGPSRGKILSAQIEAVKPGLCKNRSSVLKNDSRSGPTRKRAGVTGGFAKDMGWRGV